MARTRAQRVREARPKYAGDAETVSASEFRARCLELIERIQHTRGEITVTRYGRPVAKLVPVEAEQRSAWGWMRGSVIELGDIIAPIGVEWEANE